MSDKCCDFKIDYTKINIFNEFNCNEIKYPVVVSVPHAGSFFPKEFLSATTLTVDQLRSNEDLFVDLLVNPLINDGINVLSMNIARAFIDVNRDKIELDAKMFYDYPYITIFDKKRVLTEKEITQVLKSRLLEEK